MFLLQKRAEAGITESSNVADSKVIEPAIFKVKKPLYPKKSTNFLIALLCSLLFPLILMFVIDIFNDKIIENSYKEFAVTTILDHMSLKNNVARQIFLDDEILALLPISNTRTSIVWSVKKKIIDNIRLGWENGAGAAFRKHFLDWDEARYFEGGGRKIHNKGHGTYLFRWINDTWKVVHTQSVSKPVK